MKCAFCQSDESGYCGFLYIHFRVEKGMESVTIKIFSRSEDLPLLSDCQFFHSTELFKILEHTPRNTPYMVVAFDDNQRVCAHLLATIRWRASVFFPFLYTQGRIHGEGEYAEGVDREMLFRMMLKVITRKFIRKLCLYIEFSDMGAKMFGYKSFRTNEYFPVRWMQIYNSLHSKSPEERIGNKMKKRIRQAYKAGVITRKAETEEEVMAFYQVLCNFYRMKLQRFIPHKRFFTQLNESKQGQIFITTYKDKVIGGCAVVYSRKDAFLWYIASRRASYAKFHPNLMTIWNVLQTTYEDGREHLRFMNVGLPFQKNLYREFILSFGGKPVSSYRWFRISVGWLNKLLRWIYRE